MRRYTISAYAINPVDMYKSLLDEEHIRYICTIRDFIDITFYTTACIDDLTFVENMVEYNSLTDDPDNVYDEVDNKMSNIYNLICSKYVLNTHTFKGPNGPKCVVTFGEHVWNRKEDEIIITKYFNPITKQFQVNSEISDIHIRNKLKYTIEKINFELITWNFKRVKNIPKHEDEIISENQMGISMCKVCLEKKIKILFLPCKHAICCIKCSTLVIACPLCRCKINIKMDIFIG
ncbi:hypothetical protein AGMMS49579_01460 [Spirochaetia bacterium]|nr:hypothetical protein AGMMS49579_01460 [Spirochaetia bacterium]